MPRSILVVDDEPEGAAELVRTLQQEGYSVTFAESGTMALGFLACERPDMLICDLEMPDYTGYQIMEAAAVQLNMPDLPVVLAHNHWTRDNLWLPVCDRTSERGTADCFISKPYVVGEIPILMRRIFKSIEENQAANRSG